MLEKKNVKLSSLVLKIGMTVPTIKAAINPGQALNGRTVETGDAVESTTYATSSCDTRCLSVSGFTVAPARTVLTVPPW